MDYGQHSEISLCKQANFIKIINQFVTSQETIQIITHHHVKGYFSSVLNVKAVVAAFNQEKALVGAFSVITNLRICFGWNFLKH